LRQGVPFAEKNVAADSRALKEMLRVSGQQGVPVITVDDQVVIGFDQRRLMQLLPQARQSAKEAGPGRPRLGASIADAATQVHKHPGIPSEGAYVGVVRTGSAAEQAGLRPGDVITALGGQSVASAEDVHRLVQQLSPGREISLTYVRDGRGHQAMLRL
jgi:S1-C subfamily serine protease